MDETDPKVSLEQQIEALRQLYVDSLAERREQLETLWARLESAPEDVETGREFQRLAHKIAGSAGSYGLTALGELAQELDTSMDQAFRDPGVNQEPLHSRIAGPAAKLLDALRKAMNDPR